MRRAVVRGVMFSLRMIRVTTRAARVRVRHQELLLARNEPQLPHSHEEVVEQRAEDTVRQSSASGMWLMMRLLLLVLYIASPDAHELQREQLIVDPVRYFPIMSKSIAQDISSCSGHMPSAMSYDSEVTHNTCSNTSMLRISRTVSGARCTRMPEMKSANCAIESTGGAVDSVVHCVSSSRYSQ